MSSLACTSPSHLHSLASCRGGWTPQRAAQNARQLSSPPSLALVVQAASRGTSKAFANASAGQHIPLQRLAPVTGGGRPPLNGGGGGGSPSSSSSSSSVPRTGQDSLNGSSSGAGAAAPLGAAAAKGGGSSGGAAAAPVARPGGTGSKQTQEDWLDLLQTPDADMLGSRARSASDAAVLRRKGHLKEQDKFIQFVLDMHQTHTSLEVMQKMERWIIEHRKDPRTSRLRRMVPSIGSFFVPLKLVDAFLEYDEFFALSRRQYVHPNFAELRHILNIAQVHSSAQYLKLITFDADGTLYADGHHIEHDNEMIRHIIALMRSNIHVAIVTAAGYPGAPERFEQRVEGLLAAFRQYNLPQHITDRFHIMGGECNYLLRVSGCPAKRLEFVPDAEWKGPLMMSWTEEQCQALLDSAERLLLEGAHRLRLPVEVIRKERACGVVPTAPTIYEVLEELAITVQNQLQSDLPFCAFNGGNDVFVDVGNKSLGLEALMGHLGLAPAEVMHVGDRFSDTGNDSATRDCCSILWVANPEETDFFIKLLLTDIREMKKVPVYIE